MPHNKNMDNKKGNEMNAEVILRKIEEELYNPFIDWEDVLESAKSYFPGVPSDQVDKLLSNILEYNDEESARLEMEIEAGYM